MERGGVHSFRLFVLGDISVGYIELDDVERFNREYIADPDCRQWERRVGEFKRSGVEVESGEMPLIEEVWAFEAE